MSTPLQAIVKIVDCNDSEGFGYIDYIFVHTYAYLYRSSTLTILTNPCNSLELNIIKINNVTNSLLWF